MKSFTDNDTKEDLEGIKRDIESLARRLGNLKDHSIKNMAEQVEDLGKVLLSFKDKGIDIGKDNFAEIYSSTCKHPLRNLICAFTGGMLVCWLLKK